MKPIDRQLKILDQATFLIGMAKAENTDLSISQAIEIIKIDHLQQIEDILDSCNPNDNLSDTNCTLDDILYSVNGIMPTHIAEYKAEQCRAEKEAKRKIKELDRKK